jgi:hypothetical protein
MTTTIALLDAIDAMESLEAGAVYRTFTTEQSSAIFNLYIEKNFVEVIFHSNTDRAYGFTANFEFCIRLIDAISYTDLPYSVGKMIAQGRKNGDLTPIED